MRFFLLLILAMCVHAADNGKPVTWSPGCLAKVYLCGSIDTKEYPSPDFKDVDPAKLWPDKKLSEGAAETLRLNALPEVEPPSLKDYLKQDGLQSNVLLPQSKALAAGVHFYTVEFEGYLFTSDAGVYTITVQSDDPVEVYVEGRLVANQESWADPKMMFTGQFGDSFALEFCTSPLLKPTVSSRQGAIRCSPNRYYHVSVIARQLWLPISPAWLNGAPKFIPSRNLNRGAFFKATLNRPDGTTGPIPLQLPKVD